MNLAEMLLAAGAIPYSADDGAEAALRLVCNGEESPELIEAMRRLCFAHSHHGEDIAVLGYGLCSSLRVRPRVRGAVLREVWGGGKLGSPLGGLSKSELLAMFEFAHPDTLMDDGERKVLDALPDEIELWRGAPGLSARRAAAGISWTLNRDRARWFADAYRPLFGPSLVVRAAFPRAAVLAYFGEREEQELIVNWRRARRLKVDATYAMAQLPEPAEV